MQIIAEAMLFSYKADWRGGGKFKCFGESGCRAHALKASGKRFAVHGVDVAAGEA